MRKILVVHNRYSQHGGEDEAVAAEIAMLRSRGHELVELFEDNRRAHEMRRSHVAANTIWSREWHSRLTDVLKRFRPDIAHFHNTFLLISPSAYYACRDAGVPVVQTLHNYRLLCPNAIMLRDGEACHLCVGRAIPWSGVWHACYRGSRAESAVVAGMLTIHRMLGTWQDRVHAYIALTEFARRTFVEGGLPADKLFVKPNFVDPDPGAGDGRGEYALFVGRLAEDKGLEILLRAWALCRPSVALKIIGDGPLRGSLAEIVRELPGVELLGWKPKGEVIDQMKGAAFLVLPSLAYEGFPMAIAEAYATGLPVIASGHGSLAEIIIDGQTGLLSRPGDAIDLGAKIRTLLDDKGARARMRELSRAEFTAKYSADRNYARLVDVYSEAISASRSTQAKPLLTRV